MVISGIGLRSGLGPTTQSSWQGLRSGLSAATVLPLKAGPGRIWAGYPILDASPDDEGPGVQEARAALDDAELLQDGTFQGDRTRAATVVGLSKGDLNRLVRWHRSGLGDLVGSIGDWTDAWPDAGARAIGRAFELQGPRLAPIAACATGVVAVLRAAELIRQGACDLALAGAVDRSLEPLVLGAFDRMGAMARVENDPGLAVRPWDRARSGFLVGEGGAVLLLEREDHARARGVLPYAEVAGGALGSDAVHLTNLDPDPTRLAALIVEALQRSGVEPGEVDCINVHGTATRVNDPLECQAIRRALGSHADHVSCSANKAQIGHLLGGAGAAELAITCLSIRDQFVPPTLNLTDPDPQCDLDGTPTRGRFREIRTALKLSLGFGGHLAVVVLRRPDGSSRMTPEPVWSQRTL
ncbi:beta-ketoacyl-[acyl-carrier-protein] synthase family protein [Tautonia marina]|uniref:beta-ketoacyl-[acyl-carrier-protein] synthase family protein n=1 Tax=Tautonia marina TaxID=2653855 RepID=UPI001F43EB87|nr:beta-ketoacyl-[acyl-carrier-protein] synthase family protein [Tautonia marina]